MPTDTPTGEREMAREALGLLEGWLADGMRRGVNRQLGQPECIRWHAVHKHTVTANGILNDHDPCPGFWGEVLAAVRVLAGDPHLHIERDRWGYSRVTTFTSAGKRDYLTHGMAGEPAAILAAILAALRAVVGAADA